MWRRWLDVSMVRWEKRIEALSTDERMRLADQCASACVWLARLNAYISRRISGGKHKDGVVAQNRAARKVRQALGYTYADDKITF